LQERDLIVGLRENSNSRARGIVEAALQACRLRLGPFVHALRGILAGPIPLVSRPAQGSEVARAGVTVVAGMIRGNPVRRF